MAGRAGAVRAWWHRAWARLGRRGTFLLFLALLDILIGYSYLAPVPAPLHPVLLNYVTWGWAWTVTGVTLAVGAFMRRDRVFFALAAFMKAAWAGAYADTWVSHPEVARSWVSAVVWAAFAGIVLLVAWWPEFP